MNTIDDERLLFYLANKAYIDAWAQVRSTESVALDQFCTTLHPDVPALAEELDVVTFRDTIGYTSMIGMHRPSWQIGDERPAPMVGVAWFNTRGGAAKPGSFTDQWLTPWVGVRTRRSGPYSAATAGLTALLAVSQNSEFTDADRGQTDNWPIYSWEAVGSDASWADLSPFRTQIVGRLRTAWDMFAPMVDDHLMLDLAQGDS